MIKKGPAQPLMSMREHPKAWDKVVISNGRETVELPGFSTVTGFGISELDVKSTSGGSGTSTQFLADKGFTFKIHCTYFDDQDELEAITRAVALIRPSEKRVGVLGRLPILISHPGLAFHGIYQANNAKASIPAQSSKYPGMFEIEFECVQYWPTITKTAATKFAATTTIQQLEKQYSKPSAGAVPDPPRLQTGRNLPAQ